MVMKRMTISLINIFCRSREASPIQPVLTDALLVPPLAVLLLCGPETDLIINCLLFLAAVIPSHIHGFYISCTYFNRKRKVRKGVFPGKHRGFIYSERVQNGGASAREVEKLRKQQQPESMAEKVQGSLSRVRTQRSSGSSEDDEGLDRRMSRRNEY